MVVGTILLGFTNSAILFNLLSGTVITPTLGSIVQNGKLAACAFALLKQLNKVDFPTLGKPTIPHCNAIFLFFGCWLLVVGKLLWSMVYGL
jgi:hypothetical protein